MLVVSSLLANFTWCACGMKSKVDEGHLSHLIFKSDYFNVQCSSKILLFFQFVPTRTLVMYGLQSVRIAILTNSLSRARNH